MTFRTDPEDYINVAELRLVKTTLQNLHDPTDGPSRQKRGSVIRPVQLPQHLLEHARLAGYGLGPGICGGSVSVSFLWFGGALIPKEYAG